MKKKTKSGFWSCFAVSTALAIILSAVVMVCAADIFALFDDDTTPVVITTDGTSSAADVLKQNGMIRYKFLFRAWCALRGVGELPSGTATVSRDMDYDMIISAINSHKKVRTTVRITIPEGATTDEIFAIFVSHGIGTADGFVGAADDDYGYDYIPTDRAGRTYRCDGYLYPETYYFYSDATEHEVIARLIATFDSRLTDEMRQSITARGYTVDDAVIIASIVQKEVYYTAEMGAVASVLYNRLHSRVLDRLECDSTLAYAWRVYGGDGEYLELDSPYNSYKYAGLVPGAICSPGRDALTAAACPKITDYYYFFSSADKTTVFSKTYSEHLSSLKKWGKK